MWNRPLIRLAGLAVIFCAGVCAGAAWTHWPVTYADEVVKEPPEKKKRGTPFGPMLIEGLNSTPGCLKAESARTLSGKALIFGWFEDKAAVKRWYFSEAHQKMLDRFAPERDRTRIPISHIPDDVEPIMFVASVTLPGPEDVGFPQISIEAYTPLHAGFSHGGLFGPDEFKERFMHYDDLSSEESEDSAESAGK